MEVPPPAAKPPPGTDESMREPGASSDRKDALFEKGMTRSAERPPEPSLVAPTLIAVEMQAGKSRALKKSTLSSASFPEAITVAMPTDARLAMAFVIAGIAASQNEKKGTPARPMLRFAAAML
jgi:hypothetical protein